MARQSARSALRFGVSFLWRTFGRERGRRLISRRKFLGEARRSNVIAYLNHCDVDALLSAPLSLDLHESALPLQPVATEAHR